MTKKANGKAEEVKSKKKIDRQKSLPGMEDTRLAVIEKLALN